MTEPTDTDESESIEEPDLEPEVETDDEEPDTFPRAYVEDLRAEAAEHRTRARDNGARADLLAERLLAQTVASVTSEVLADPSDLLDLTDHHDLVDENGLPDPDLIETAAAQLVERKPHLARRRPSGTVDQGAREPETPSVDLAGILRSVAR